MSQLQTRRSLVVQGLLLAGTALAGACSSEVRAQVHDHGQGAPQAPPPAPPRDFSIYDHDLQITRSNGSLLRISALKGSPVLMTMFFATCPSICPLMTEQILQVEDQLSPEARARLRVLMVSFDESDTLERLSGYGRAHRLDPIRWIVGKGAPAVNAHLADMLGVRFERLPNGSYNHTAMVDMVDVDGTIAARIPGTSLDDPRFAAAVKALVAASAPTQG